jgi:hypothetical protein
MVCELCPLLMAGHVSSRHCAIAASLRCLARMVGHAEGQLDHGGNPAAGPQLSPEAIGFGTAAQQCRQLGQLIGAQPSGHAGWWTGSECLRSNLVTISFTPVRNEADYTACPS